MTPGARLSASIELLDAIFTGDPPERALTRWARNSRFAGSKDRAAVRDIVFDCLRRRRSLGWLGGADTGRAIVAARETLAGTDLDKLFTGDGFDPAPLAPGERAALARDPSEAPRSVQLDVPETLESALHDSLGDAFEAVMRTMQERAPVDLRVNTLKSNLRAAMVVLARDGVQASPLPQRPEALRVMENSRLVAASRAYSQGMVELQDISSQIAAAEAGAEPGMTVLDYCAGGGGKALALAAATGGSGRVLAWDINARRMNDLPGRARRAGAGIDILDAERLMALGPVCDLVFVDAPCSGSGVWRRKPGGKWLLTPEALDKFPVLQDGILDSAARLVRPGGLLVYATCSLFRVENEDRVSAFSHRHPDWPLHFQRRLSPLEGGDGFFLARFRAPES